MRAFVEHTASRRPPCAGRRACDHCCHGRQLVVHVTSLLCFISIDLFILIFFDFFFPVLFPCAAHVVEREAWGGVHAIIVESFVLLACADLLERLDVVVFLQVSLSLALSLSRSLSRSLALSLALSRSFARSLARALSLSRARSPSPLLVVILFTSVRRRKWRSVSGADRRSSSN